MALRKRRRRRTSRRTYTIGYLLANQPKTLERQPQYRQMLVHYHSSPRLQRVILSSRCYGLLNSARIRPDNLQDFYRTYHLPKDPFFPLFFAAKRGYQGERERIRQERHRYIIESVRRLDPPVVAAIKYLGHLERRYNAAGMSPVWQEALFPSTKKKANEYHRFESNDWFRLFAGHIKTLRRRYRRITEDLAERVLACIALELLPPLEDDAAALPLQPSETEVRRSYRKLSMLHHPDLGGDGAMFIRIKKARDLLLGE